MPDNRNDVPSFSLLAKEKEAKRKSSPKLSPGPSAARFALFRNSSPRCSGGIQTAGKTAPVLSKVEGLRLPDGPAAQASGYLIVSFSGKRCDLSRNGGRSLVTVTDAMTISGQGWSSVQRGVNSSTKLEMILNFEASPLVYVFPFDGVKRRFKREW